MSTRAHIVIVKDATKKSLKEILDERFCLLYKHCGGHIESLGNILKDFMKTEGFKKRSDDDEYITANLLCYIGNRNRRDMEEMSDYTDIGICNTVHEDVEYFYVYEIDTESIIVFKADERYRTDGTLIDILY